MESISTFDSLNELQSVKVNRELQTDSWTPVIQTEEAPCCLNCLRTTYLILVWFIVVITFPFGVFFFWIKTVQEYERAVVFRVGTLRRREPLGPGLIFVLPWVDVLHIVDMRIVTFDILNQFILTKDACTVSVDATVYYKVEDPVDAIQKVLNYRQTSWILAGATLRAVFGRTLLSEILTERESIAREMRSILDRVTATWGMIIKNVEIKDVRLPAQLQRAMAAEAEATRDARARIISAEGEKQAAQNLVDASRIIASSPAALKLRYLQTILTIAAEKKSTILFPVPMKM